MTLTCSLTAALLLIALSPSAQAATGSEVRSLPPFHEVEVGGGVDLEAAAGAPRVEVSELAVQGHPQVVSQRVNGGSHLILQ